MTAASPVSPAVKAIQRLPFLDNGRWVSSSSDRFGQVFNPSRGNAIAEVPFCTAQEVDHVVRSAAAALEEWAETPVVERVRVLFKFRQICLDRFDSLAACVTREHGKTLAEAKASVQRGIEVIEFACGVPSLIMGDSLANIARGVDNETIRHPVGVCVGITPFNFPFMVPLWMFPIAIACGNTFVLKPSERVPMSANLLGEMMIEAGLPPGVFNIVHGDKTCVDALLDPSAGQGDQLCGIDCGCATCLRNRRASREARPGGGGGQESSHRHARCRPRPGCGCGANVGVRLRRRAVHGRLGRGARRRRGPGFGGPSD